MSLPLALLLAVTAAGPRVAVVVHATGLTDDDTRRLQDKVGAEVNATGAEMWTLSRSLEVKTECLTDRGCAREVLKTADAAWLVWVEALRAGGQLQLDVRLLDADGGTAAEADSAARVDDVLGGGIVLPAAIAGPLKASATGKTTVAVATPTGPNTATKPPDAGIGAPPVKVEPLTPEVPPSSPAPAGLSPVAVGGIAAVGAGALMALAGSAIAVNEIGVIQTASSSGAEKTGAANVAGAMFVVTGVGLVIAAGGGVLLYVGL